MLPIVKSARLGGRTGRAANGSPSFLHSVEEQGQMQARRDALPGPVGPRGCFQFHLPGWYAQILQVQDLVPSLLEMLLARLSRYLLCSLASFRGSAGMRRGVGHMDMASGRVCGKHFLCRNAAIGTEAERL